MDNPVYTSVWSETGACFGRCGLCVCVTGVAVVQGSHKTNYPAPTSLLSGMDWTQHVTEVNAKAGCAPPPHPPSHPPTHYAGT